MVVLYGLALYVAIGLVTAVAFVAVGVTQVMHLPITLGARILLLPGATILWPYVMSRWLKSRPIP